MSNYKISYEFIDVEEKQVLLLYSKMYKTTPEAVKIFYNSYDKIPDIKDKPILDQIERSLKIKKLKV